MPFHAPDGRDPFRYNRSGMDAVAFADFLVRHGVTFVFLYVLADQIGVPLPAIPALLAMGALAAVGKIDFGLALAASVIASLLADIVWYTLGRTRGSQVLALLCKISLEPDSCVRRTQDVFVRHGVRSLIFAKFVPGLSTIAPPLAGVVGVPVTRFLVYSAAAGFLWAGSWGAVGYLAGDALQRVVDGAGRLGRMLIAVVLVAVVVYVAVKWIQRQRFLRGLRVARITPAELRRGLESRQPPFVVDLRSPLDVVAEPFVIPGAIRIAPADLERGDVGIPVDQDVVVYCS
jgi:membrane protein DedA with SNARE-associated domain